MLAVGHDVVYRMRIRVRDEIVVEEGFTCHACVARAAPRDPCRHDLAVGAIEQLLPAWCPYRLARAVGRYLQTSAWPWYRPHVHFHPPRLGRHIGQPF